MIDTGERSVPPEKVEALGIKNPDIRWYLLVKRALDQRNGIEVYFRVVKSVIKMYDLRFTNVHFFIYLLLFSLEQTDGNNVYLHGTILK